MILLREKRTEKGLSQKELAELSGVPQQNISYYEQGVRVPGADSLYRLAVALGTTMDRLYQPDGPKTGTADGPDGGAEDGKPKEQGVANDTEGRNERIGDIA